MLATCSPLATDRTKKRRNPFTQSESSQHLCAVPLFAGQRAVVITLTRAGEDNKTFQLTDLDSTFQGFAGADYDLQVRLALQHHS